MSSSSLSRAAILAQWEQADSPLAPITPSQRDSILEVAAAASNRPLPKEMMVATSITASEPMTTSVTAPSFSSANNGAAGGTADTKSVGSGADLMSSSSAKAASNSTGTPLHPAVAVLERKGRKVDTGHQFLEWLHQVENNLQFQEDAPYRAYIEQLERHKEDADDLLSQVDEGLEQLKVLGEQYKFVSTKSNSLHTAAEHLLEEQTKLASLSEKVSEKLVFFTEADRISQKLTSTALSVNSDAFFQLLDRIDECMLYVLDHPTYKQTGAYRVKYQACLSRALGLVRSHVKASLEGATNAAAVPQTAASGAAQSAAVRSATDTAFTLFYGKFRAQAPRIAKVVAAVEQRTDKNNNGKRIGDDPDPGAPLWQEYESVLSDCQQVYFSCRGQLLLPSVRSCVAEMAQKYRRDHCGLVRAGCTFLLHVCEDEYQLFHQFFQKDSESLGQFLEGLCQVLYDTLRPLVIHLHHLETLSELTGILRSEMLGHHCAGAGHPPQLSAFERVISQLLQDVQERLVYRAHIYVRTDILGYSPAPGDLAYPEKLEMMEQIAQSIQQQQQQDAAAQPSGHQRQNSTSSLTSATSMEVAQINGQAPNRNSHASHSPADLHGMWYPPVRRTLVCLSKLYRCLDREIFQGLSQEALSACMDSVALAAEQIAANTKGGKEAATSVDRRMDGQLFRIKHLLILREQIAPFHVDFAVRELGLDFSKIKTAAVSLFTTKKAADMLTLSSNNALLEFLLDGTMPEVKEYCRDSRKEVDRQLKAVCESFIAFSVSTVVKDMQEFVKQVEDHRRTDKTLNISREPWGRPDRLQTIVAQAQRMLKKHFPVVQRAMQLYLANRETEFILFRPIRNNVMSCFISFLQLTRQDYTPDQQIIIGCPSQEQIAVMITSLQLQPKTPRASVSKDRSTPIKEATSPPLENKAQQESEEGKKVEASQQPPAEVTSGGVKKEEGQ